MFSQVTERTIDLNAPPPTLAKKDGLYILILCRGDIDPDWQLEMAKKIALAMPVLAAAWGPGTTSWDDAIDDSAIIGQIEGWLPKDLFILTTWHDDEPLAETVDFLATNIKYEDAPIDKLLILNMGNTSAKPGDVAQMLKARD